MVVAFPRLVQWIGWATLPYVTYASQARLRTSTEYGVLTVLVGKTQPSLSLVEKARRVNWPLDERN